MRRCSKLKSAVIGGGGGTGPFSSLSAILSCSTCESGLTRGASSNVSATYLNSSTFPSSSTSSPAWRRSIPQQNSTLNKRHFSSLCNSADKTFRMMDGSMGSCQSLDLQQQQLRHNSNDRSSRNNVTSSASASPSSADSKLLENSRNSHYFSEDNFSNCSTNNSAFTSSDNNKNSEFNTGINGIPTKVMQQSSSKSSVSNFGFATAASSSYTPVRTVVTSQRLVEVNRDSTMEQPKLMSKEEREEFMSVYHGLVKDLLEVADMKDMEETNRWMARVLQYNVPHGKRNRGLYTALAYKYFAPDELTEENVRLSHILGWCVEILQAFFLVSDDIMDGSETRRGRPCWYKVDNLGLAAVNDALLLEATIYQILRKHFSGKTCYPRLMEVMHDISYKTIFGQSLDTRTGQDRRMETYTMERYSSIVKYKTSYYSFYLPVALAMTLSEIKDPNLFQQARKVTLEMGHFFQVQDDYLDCFGDVEVTGKIGTDIQDCKCSWLFVVATQRCTPEQKKFLLENYGVNEPAKIEAVKKLYKDLQLEDVYHNYEEQTYNLICTHIQQMNEELPKGLFYDMLHKIYKRSS